MKSFTLAFLLLPFVTATQVTMDEPHINSGKPNVADLLTLQTSSSIFYSYARDTRLSELFTSEGSSISVLVPTNKAVMALSRKPHESKVDPNIRITEEAYEELSKRSVERWISAHIIPSSPLEFSSSVKYETLLSGKSVTFTRPENAHGWERVHSDHGFTIIDAQEGSNGMLYIIDGTVDPTQD